MAGHVPSPRREADNLWAITSYFNPIGYRSKRANYRVFCEHLKVPLVTVELAYGPDFELGEDNAEILVQVRGGDILWQKERLLNLALRALPSHCRKVAWLDCDILLERHDWPDRVSDLLDRVMLVQMFSHVFSMPRDWVPEKSQMENYERTQPSAASVIASGIAPAICLRGSPDAKTSTAASGFAWAARREVLDRHGFYDACIVGGGPGAFASAAYDCFDHAMHIQYMNARQKEHYLAWAEPCHETIRSEASFLEGNLFHLWHGKTEHREYRQRHEKFSRFNFDPLADIMCEPKGAWRWNSDKTTMHNHVRDYFVSRREDG